MTDYAKQFGVVKQSDLPPSERRKAKRRERRATPTPATGTHKPLEGNPVLSAVMDAIRKAGSKTPPKLVT